MQKWYSELQGMSVGDKYLTTNETEITFFFEAVEPFVHVKRQAYEFDYRRWFFQHLTVEKKKTVFELSNNKINY